MKVEYIKTDTVFYPAKTIDWIKINGTVYI